MATIEVPKGRTPEDIQRGLALLEKAEKQKAKDKEKMKDPKFKEKMKLQGQKATAYTKIMLEKARKAGITVTKEEVEKYLASKLAAK